jgi:ubiquinone/menaquinone biosynthesis C-methylase UbiE
MELHLLDNNKKIQTPHLHRSAKLKKGTTSAERLPLREGKVNFPHVDQLRKDYNQGENIMQLLRQSLGTGINTPEIVELSYDLQAGSYIKNIKNKPQQHEIAEQYVEWLIIWLRQTYFSNILEAGVGEATTLAPLLTKLYPIPEKGSLGFDISWSRLKYAKAYCRNFNVQPTLFVGDLTEIPLVDNSIDLIITSGSIEPNHGSEISILQELYRVARKRILMIEPAGELGSEDTRRRIDEHSFCRNLKQKALDLGYHVVEHSMVPVDWDRTEYELLIIDKPEPIAPIPEHLFACPSCKQTLRKIREHFFCERDGKIFPVIDGIPCLRSTHGILGSIYSENEIDI